MTNSVIQILLAFCYFHGTVLSQVYNGFALQSSEAANTDARVDPITYYGSLLSRQLKVLSDQSNEDDLGPRLRPESRYVRYMKRLYRMSSKQERTTEGGTSQVYNTVRLITSRDQCLEQNEDYFMQDISYNLARVRAQEQLLKSILLYSFDKEQATSFTSVCYLNVKEQHADHQLCSSTHHSVRFQVQTEKRSHRKWVEVDVTAFLHPLIRSRKKDIHLLINLTCAEDRGTSSSTHERKGSVELSLGSPSLLLYLNDTNMAAHQKCSSPQSPEQLKPSVLVSTFIRRLKSREFKPKKNTVQWRRRLKKREATHTSTLAEPTAHLPRYEFPTDDCNLYDFRVSFSQLKLDHWIIAPHKYNPRYCKGICPRAVSSIYGSPVHTVVQNIIYEQLDSSVPRPSCVPSEYNPLSVLIIENDGSIAYKEYEEMIATKCTCR